MVIKTLYGFQMCVKALKGYTKTAAYASFEENRKGTLTAGKLADFVILSENITKINPVRIKDVHVLKTYLGGIKRYDSEE